MFRRSLTVLTCALALGALAWAVPASASAIDFGTGSAGLGGTLTITGDVSGTDIFIDSLTVSGAPTNNGEWNVDGTGVCPTGVDGSCGLLSFDQLANTISIVGSVPGLGILDPIVLLSGDLSGGVNVLVNMGGIGAISASGLDTKSPDLLIALGMSPTTKFDYFGFSTGIDCSEGNCTDISTDITNTTAVPEPAPMLLLGSGLVACAGLLRRKLFTS